MITLRQFITTVCLGTCLSAGALYAADTAPATSASAPVVGHRWQEHRRGGPLGAYGLLLHKLNLTAEQKAQVKAIVAAEKGQFEALHASVKDSMKALATTPPTDTAAYAALVAKAQENAATRIGLETAAWSKIYSTVLTGAQQAEIPNIVAAAEAAREQRMSAWREEHPQT